MDNAILESMRSMSTKSLNLEYFILDNFHTKSTVTVGKSSIKVGTRSFGKIRFIGEYCKKMRQVFFSSVRIVYNCRYKLL